MNCFQPISSEVVQDRQIPGQNGKVSEIGKGKRDSSGINPDDAIQDKPGWLLQRSNQSNCVNMVSYSSCQASIPLS